MNNSQTGRPIKDKSLVLKPSGCMEYPGARLPSGYGWVWFAKRMRGAHVVSYMLFTGKNPGKLFVCHKCDNPPCCNPDHLFLGSAKDNRDDMVAKGRFVGRGASVS